MAHANSSREDKNLPDDSNDLKGGPGKYSFKLASFWNEQIRNVEKLEEAWHKRADEIIRRFRDDRKKADMDLTRRLNVLWSNYKILAPALYGKPPIPVIERRYLQKDPVGRTSSIILERNCRYQLEINGFDSAMKRAVQDYLLPGRGVVWVRYEPEIGQGDSLPTLTEGGVEDELMKIEKEAGDGEAEESEESEKLENTGEQLLAEQAPVDYIHFKDFKMIPRDARTWDEVQAIAKKVYISKAEARERFGDKVAADLQPDTTDQDAASGRRGEVGTQVIHDHNERSISIYEIWNKTDRRIYWTNLGYKYLCGVKEDFLKLKRFFPVPEPISSTLTNDSLIPVPDYWEYQDQAIQIDEITQRLALLTKACKIAGTYDSSNGALKRLLKEGFENDLLPVDSWAVFAEKGGVKGGISFLPIEEIQKVIETLQKVRQQLMQDLDLITGITDVQRGTTDSRETLGGIRLKNNTTGSRLSERQNEVARFARDTLAIVAEIAAKHFEDKTLIQCSGILFDDSMQPKNIMADMQDMGMAQQPQMPQIPQMPQTQTPQIPGQIPPAPQMPGNNVVPFPQQPGMQQPNMQSPMPMGGLPMMPMAPQIDPMMIIGERIEKAIDLLRSEVPLGYRIEIETDSTIFGDSAQDKQDATEFLQAGIGLLQGMAPLGKEMPEAVPLFGRMLQWGTRKMRVGRDLESAIDTFVELMEKKARDAIKNPPPDPEAQKAQAELNKIQMETDARKQEIALEQQSAQAEMMRDKQKQDAELQHEMQLAAMEAKNKMALAQADTQIKQQQANMQIQQGQQQMAMESQKHQMTLAMDKQKADQDLAVNNQKTQQQMQLADKQHAHSLEAADLKAQSDKAAHQAKMKEMKFTAAEKVKAAKQKKTAGAKK